MNRDIAIPTWLRRSVVGTRPPTDEVPTRAQRAVAAIKDRFTEPTERTEPTGGKQATELTDRHGRKSSGHEPSAAQRFDGLLELAYRRSRPTVAIVHPADEQSLRTAADIRDLGLAVPLLVGPASDIEAVGDACEIDISGFEIVSTRDASASVVRAVELSRSGDVHAIVKGSLRTDLLLRPMLCRDTGLRTDRRMSHCFVIDLDNYHKHLIITDAVINLKPTLDAKRDIIQNAIDLALLLGIEMPKVAVLAPAETVSAQIPVTVEAAALAKMADRGQIRGGLIDGPLALDLAVSRTAVLAKRVTSSVAGDADILMVPDLGSGNMLAKSLKHLGGGLMAGVVLGAQVPIALTSRADGAQARVASVALAALLAGVDDRDRADSHAQ